MEGLWRRYRPRDRRHRQRSARQPVHVLEEGADDLGDADRGDREIVGAEPEADLADEERYTGGDRAAEDPASPNRKAETADPVGSGLDVGRSRIDLRAEEDVGGDPRHDDRDPAKRARDAQPMELMGADDDDSADRRGARGAEEKSRAVRSPRTPRGLASP